MAKAVVAVAFSGGRDSTALLHATLAAAAPLGLSVQALHVHHGLHPRADDWLGHCRRRCRRWASAGWPVSFAARRLEGAPAAGDSIEAWARRERYRALSHMVLEAGADLVLLGHHRRDQAETFLLQALRGGGAASLAAMPRVALRGGIAWARPWLAQPREAVEAYLRRHRLSWIDDGSNDDLRFARNRLRARVWPGLTAAFPDAEACLVSAALRAQEASALLAEVATADLAAVACGASLDIAAWHALTPARRDNALRAWLRGAVDAAVPGSLVRRLASELGADRARCWPVPGGDLRSHRGRLGFEPTRESTPGTARVVDLRRIGLHPMPDWHGAIDVAPTCEGGVALAMAGRLELCARAGGERFQAGPGRPARSLKKQYQAADVPAWARDGPILRSEGRSVFVPGLGIDARAVAPAGVPQVSLRWLPGGGAMPD